MKTLDDMSCLAVSTQYRRMTDRQTLPAAITRYAQLCYIARVKIHCLLVKLMVKFKLNLWIHLSLMAALMSLFAETVACMLLVACVQVACHCYQQYYDTMKPVGDRDIAQQTTKNV